MNKLKWTNFLIVFSLGLFAYLTFRFWRSNSINVQFLSFGDDYSVDVLSRGKLPFVPIDKDDYDCDDLFSGSHLDYFNFTRKYFSENPDFKKFLSKWSFSGDGHAEMFPTEFKVLHFFGSLQFAKSYCETGFNYGHSSFSALTAREDSKVLSFDIGYHGYTKEIMKHFTAKYVNRFTAVLGDSMISLPNFIKENPLHRCNFIFVDGSHSYNVGYSDLKNFGEMAEKDNLIVLDDFPTRDNAFVNKLGKAWEQAKKENILTELMRCTRKTDPIRGFCIGKFNKP